MWEQLSIADLGLIRKSNEYSDPVGGARDGASCGCEERADMRVRHW